MSSVEYKDLGTANLWYYSGRSEPVEFTRCHEAKHTLKSVNKGRCLNVYMCDVCKIKYTVDSSD